MKSPLETSDQPQRPSDQTSVQSANIIQQQLRQARNSSTQQGPSSREIGLQREVRSPGKEKGEARNDVLRDQAKIALEDRRKQRRQDTFESLPIARELRQEHAEGFTIAIENADKPGEMIEIRYIIPESFLFFRDFSIASILDFDKQARDLHTHLTNGQTNEALVSLYQLQQEQGAVDALNHALKRIYRIDLNTMLAEHWSGPTLEYGRQLIGMGKKTSRFAITHAPNTPEDCFNIAKRLDYILNKTKEFIPEQLLAALIPLRRNANLIHQVKRRYETKRFGSKNLLTDIREKLGTAETADFAEFLWGGPKLEKMLTLQEAERLSAAFSHQRFEFKQPYGESPSEYARIPYSYPQDGCAEQSAFMGLSMKEMGCASEQVGIIGRISDYSQSVMKLATDYAGDADIHEQLFYEYDYHIAPKITVQVDGKTLEYIIDPTMNQGKAKLWLPRVWQKHLYTGSIEYISLAEMKAIFEEEECRQPNREIFYPSRRISSYTVRLYPSGRIFSYTVSRNRYGLPQGSAHISLPESDIPDFYVTTGMYLDKDRGYGPEGLKKLAGFVDNSRYNALAAALRQEYRKHPGKFDAERFSRAIKSLELPHEIRSTFSRYFPKLHTSFAATLTEDQRSAFYALVRPTVP